jgi:hypothetical protein
MKINELYEIIRKEGACLWVGSACSVYAGYPNVQSLKEILNERLKVTVPDGLDTSKSLREFTEDFTVLTSRNELITNLQEIFFKIPSSTSFHDKLARIPHFQSIITTNYDKLLESSFRDSTVVTINSDVSDIKKGHRVVYKIHGDIENDKSIVITESDYVAMHNREFKDPLWASIIHEISCQNILFFGYGYEDDNVKSDFEYVYEKIGDKKKRRFMIGRSAQDLKLKKLKQRGIEYVICDAESFVDGFIKHLKAHIVADMRHKWISEDFGKKFIQSFDKKTIINSSAEGLEKIKITSFDGGSEEKMTFRSTSPALISDFKKFNESYDFRGLTFSSEHLTAFTHYMEGFVINDLSEFGELSISALPAASGICNVEFPNQDDFEIQSVNYELLNHIPGKTRVSAEVYGFKIQMDFTAKNRAIDINFQMTEPSKPLKIKHYCDIFQAVTWLLSGEKILVIAGGQTKEHQLTTKANLGEFPRYLEFYNMLRTIEKAFKVKLPAVKINQVTLEEQKKVRKLYRLIEHKYVVMKSPDAALTIDLPSDSEIMKSILKGIPENTYLVMERCENLTSKLFGVTLHLGTEQVSILEPSVESYDLVKNSAVLRPKDSAIIYRYSTFGFDKMEPERILWTVETP